MTVYLTKLKDKKRVSWKGATELPVTEYNISEEGFREKTASFTSTYHIDLSTGVYLVLIVSPYHENFSGVILSEDYEAKDKQYSYKCKDLHVLYNSKFTKTYKKTTGRHIIEDALTFGDILGSHPRSKLKRYSRQLNGLFKNSKYEMRNYGAKKRFNPMTKKYKNQKIQDKTCWEILKAYTIGTGAYIDLHVNDYGTMIVRPFNINSFRKPVATISDVNDDLSLNVNTDGLISLSGADNIFNIPIKEETSNEDTSKGDGNPYVCKNKEVWVNMDNIWGKTADTQYLKMVCDELKKLGWKVHNQGVGPSYCGSLSSAKQAKNGLRVTINGGVDIDNIREHTQDTYFAKGCASSKVLPALFWTNMDKGNSFLKGGRGYKQYKTAHDGTGKANTLPYPAAHMARSGTPFGFVFNKGHNRAAARQMAEKINNGGDSPKACSNNFFKINKKGFNYNLGTKEYGY